jgi:octaprenyl-diphosphate synthase
MDKNLSKVRSFLKKDLDEYNRTLTSVLSSNVFLIDNITKYIVKHKGKGLRPMLVILSARLLGTPNGNTFMVASIVELLHTASLIHDDVVDDAIVRRSFPSINAIWKNKISVLMGDYLLAKCLISATETKNMGIISMLAETSKRLSKGELFQIEKSRKLDITEEDYFKMISDKTAALISACCSLGAMTLSDHVADNENLRQYGENIGIAFQIKDDLLDYQGNQIILGKPVGADLREKKITLPLILSFKKAPASEKKLVIQLIKKGVTESDVKRIYDFTKTYNGLNSAHEYVQKYAERAKQNLSSFDNGQAKENALNFIEYIVNRKK